MQQSVGMLDSGSGARHYLLTWIRFSTGVSVLVICKSVVICYALPPLTHEHPYFLSSLRIPRKREQRSLSLAISLRFELPPKICKLRREGYKRSGSAHSPHSPASLQLLSLPMLLFFYLQGGDQRPSIYSTPTVIYNTSTYELISDLRSLKVGDGSECLQDYFYSNSSIIFDL